jgi:hypothetical protein
MRGAYHLEAVAGRKIRKHRHERTSEEGGLMMIRNSPFRVGCLKLALALAIIGAAALDKAGSAALANSLPVEAGQITDVTPDASGVRSFKGIPFAAPPVVIYAGRHHNL